VSYLLDHKRHAQELASYIKPVETTMLQSSKIKEEILVDEDGSENTYGSSTEAEGSTAEDVKSLLFLAANYKHQRSPKLNEEETNVLSVALSLITMESNIASVNDRLSKLEQRDSTVAGIEENLNFMERRTRNLNLERDTKIESLQAGMKDLQDHQVKLAYALSKMEKTQKAFNQRITRDGNVTLIVLAVLAGGVLLSLLRK
jgi:hypothetical protein